MAKAVLVPLLVALLCSGCVDVPEAAVDAPAERPDDPATADEPNATQEAEAPPALATGPMHVIVIESYLALTDESGEPWAPQPGPHPCPPNFRVDEQTQRIELLDYHEVDDDKEWENAHTVRAVLVIPDRNPEHRGAPNHRLVLISEFPTEVILQPVPEGMAAEELTIQFDADGNASWDGVSLSPGTIIGAGGEWNWTTYDGERIHVEEALHIESKGIWDSPLAMREASLCI